MKVYVVTYVGLSDSDHEANGYVETHVFQSLEKAKEKMAALRQAEIENLISEGRDYEILKDEDDECRIAWCGYGEQIRLEVHESKFI